MSSTQSDKEFLNISEIFCMTTIAVGSHFPLSKSFLGYTLHIPARNKQLKVRAGVQ